MHAACAESFIERALDQREALSKGGFAHAGAVNENDCLAHVIDSQGIIATRFGQRAAPSGVVLAPQ